MSHVTMAECKAIKLAFEALLAFWRYIQIYSRTSMLIPPMVEADMVLGGESLICGLKIQGKLFKMVSSHNSH